MMVADDYTENLLGKMEKYGINPDSDRKDQHFIVCKDVVDKLVDAAHISNEDYVLEIGPGIGQITEAILQKGAKLVSIEIDTRFRDIIADIKTRYASRFDVIWGSALEVEWPVDVNKIVMNPPFSILEPLLEILYARREIELISMIVGRRYYDNAIQKPGSRSFNKSALMTQAKFDSALVMEINKECFYPLSGGKSVVMTLTINKRPNPVLRSLANFYVNHREINTKFVVNQVLDLLNMNARKYKRIEEVITIRDVGIDVAILNKRLQDLSNSELAQIIQRMTSQINFQRKKPKERFLVR
ncbi:MAG: rRNA adenine N-6-methyltransferase family protein [bacterium]|nr:rRNA adenine N-6-methyltransferase family protein [bacterium]